MNDLKVKLSDQEVLDIGTELTRLFQLQDRPLDSDKKALLVKELADSGYPFKAIVSGLRVMGDKELKSIKFATIKETIRNLITTFYTGEECLDCGFSGMISMVYKNKNGITVNCCISCRCGHGKKNEQLFGTPLWNGGITQEINGIEHMLYDAYLMGGVDKYLTQQKRQQETREHVHSN